MLVMLSELVISERSSLNAPNIYLEILQPRIGHPGRVSDFLCTVSRQGLVNQCSDNGAKVGKTYSVLPRMRIFAAFASVYYIVHACFKYSGCAAVRRALAVYRCISIQNCGARIFVKPDFPPRTSRVTRRRKLSWTTRRTNRCLDIRDLSSCHITSAVAPIEVQASDVYTYCQYCVGM
jgi:hypothetical protein